jgi:polysaccharide export outer membrane protein
MPKNSPDCTKITKLNSFLFFYLLLCLNLLISGCAEEQFTSNTELKDFKAHSLELSNKAKRQEMLNSVLTAPPEETEYLLGPGDLLTVTVFETEDLNTEARVSSRGYVSLPILDRVNVLDLTVAEAEEKIESLLREKYLQNPHVSVFVKERISNQITLVGSFNKPGTYDYVSGRRFLDIVAVAEGLTDDAASIAYLTRNDRKTNKQQYYIVDIDALIKKGDMTYNVAISGGDVIFIPEAGKCFVDGAVRTPGTYPVKGDMTVTEAIVLAGGLTSYADDDRIKLIRYTGNGKREIVNLSFNELQEGVGDSIKLRDQDVIFAESSSSGLFSTGMGFTLGFMGTGIQYKNPEAHDYKR